MKNSKLKTSGKAADIFIFIAISSLHISSHCMKIGQPFYGKVLMLDYYLFCFGMPWAVCGITKRFIMRFDIFEKRFIAAFLTGLTFFAVWCAVDCAAIYKNIETTFSKLFYETFFITLTPFKDASFFMIIYLLRIELPVFIKTVKSIGLINTIFGEED